MDIAKHYKYLSDMEAITHAIEPFSGTIKEDINEWLTVYKTFASLYELEEFAIRNILIVLTKGKALSWLSYKLEHNNNMTSEELIEALRERFDRKGGAERALEAFLNDFESRIKNVNESSSSLRTIIALRENNLESDAGLRKIILARIPTIAKKIRRISTSLERSLNRLINRTELASEIAFTNMIDDFKPGSTQGSRISVNPDSLESSGAVAKKNANYKEGKPAKPTIEYHCIVHGNNTTHSTDQCNTVIHFARKGIKIVRDTTSACNESAGGKRD